MEDVVEDSKANKWTELYERGMSGLKKRELDMKKAEEKRKALEDENLRAVPAIAKFADNKRGKQHFSEYCMGWEDRRKETIEKNRSKKQELLQAEMARTVHVSPESKKILRRVNHKGPVSGWKDHFDAFMERRDGELIRGQREQRPAVGVHASSLARSQPVHERLYSEAVERRRKQAMPTIEEDELQWRLHSASKQRDASESEGMPIGDKLYEDAMIVLQKKREKEMEKALAQDTSVHVNAKSEMIVKKKGKQPVYAVRKPVEQLSKEEDLSSEMSISTPRSSRRETQGSDTSRANVEQFLARLSASERQREEMLLRQRDQKLREELLECTFSPEICQRSKHLAHENPERSAARAMKSKQQSPASQGSHRKVRPQSASLYDRSIAFLRKKEEDARRLKQAAVDNEMKECTFTPRTIGRNRTRTATSAQRPEPGSSGSSYWRSSEQDQEEPTNSMQEHAEDEDDMYSPIYQANALMGTSAQSTEEDVNQLVEQVRESSWNAAVRQVDEERAAEEYSPIVPEEHAAYSTTKPSWDQNPSDAKDELERLEAFVETMKRENNLL
jgi:hypothetical protein